MKNLNYLLFGMMLLLMAGCTEKPGKNYNKIPLVDQNGVLFIRNGIESSLTEVKASGVAITNSNNQRVIALAKMIIDDHFNAGDELTKIKKDKQVVEADTISPAHMQVINDLEKKTGKAFDRAYLQMMVADHEQAVKLFTTAAQNPDTEIKDFAAKTLPTIKSHLDSANAICAAVK